MYRHRIVTLCFLLSWLWVPTLTAQHIYTRVEADSILNDIQKRVSQLNHEDPELISLHYLFAKDIEKELQIFYEKMMPIMQTSFSSNDYYEVLNHYDNVSYYTRNVKDTLYEGKQHVDSLFYLLAINEMIYENTQEAHYYTDRALEYNPLNSNALLMKLHLLFEEDKLYECIEVIQRLYNEAKLTREQEMDISDFTLLFYNRLYAMGDSLVHNGREAEALEVFSTLEEFCHNMPSNYCNDDYYRGILRSKTGVFNSYISIARAAIERKNADLSHKFIDYAIQYMKDNQGEILDSSALLQVRKDLADFERAYYVKSDTSSVNTDPSLPSVSIEMLQSYEDDVVDTLPISEELGSEFECEHWVSLGIDACFKQNYEEAYKWISKAKKSGNCDNYILEKLYVSLKQILNR